MNFWDALWGGILIGSSATLLLATQGRIAGISGILNGALNFSDPERWRWYFLGGMLLGGGFYEYGFAPQHTPSHALIWGSMILGGFLVGLGTRIGNGCTSGHGVCGLGRLSQRSLVSVLIFLSIAMVTVFLTHHGFGLFTAS